MNDKLLFVFQIPMIDIRALLQDATAKIKFPTPPPLPKLENEFLRHFGKVRYRKDGDELPFADEGTYCSCKNLIKMPVLAENAHFLDGEGYIVRYLRCSRRFYSDSQLTARFEIIFSVNIEKRANVVPQKAILEELLEKLMYLPVHIHAKEIIKTSLIDAGKKLSAVYLNASTRKPDLDKNQSWWLTTGEPVAFVFGHKDYVTHAFKEVDLDIADPKNDVDISLFHAIKITKSEKKLKIWVCTNNTDDEYLGDQEKKIRQLRISIMRCHTQLETLKWILAYLQNGKLPTFQRGTKESDVAQKFLMNLDKVLSQNQGGVDNAKITLGYFKIEAFITPSEKTALIQKLIESDFRPLVLTKTLRLIDSQDVENRKKNIVNFLKDTLINNDSGTFFKKMKIISEIIEENELTNDLLTLKYRWQSLEKDKNLGIEMTGDLRIESNKLVNDLLTYMDSLAIDAQNLAVLEDRLA